MDRVHRIGQKRDVRVYRMVMRDSLEERMLSVQRAKEALGKGSMEKLSADEKKRARLTTLMDLFKVSESELESVWT